MNIQFSTNDSGEAKKRMQSALGKYADKATSFIDFICAKVDAGIVRIGDPAMYGEAAVFPTDKATEADLAEMKNAYDKFIGEL